MNLNDPARQPDDETIADPALEAFLDGTLPADEAEAFAQRLRDEPELQAQVDLQRRIDAGLREELAWTVSDAQAVLPDRPTGPTTTQPQAAGPFRFPSQNVGRWLKLGGIAAAVALAVTAAVYFVTPDPYDVKPLATVYHAEVQAGFVPGWVCETDFEFIETYAKRFQTPLRFNGIAGVEAIGLTYNYALGPQTVMLLAKVDGEPVLVFAGSTRLVEEPPKVGDRRFQLFERQVGSVRLFEVSPFDEARVLDQFEHLPDWDPETAADAPGT